MKSIVILFLTGMILLTGCSEAIEGPPKQAPEFSLQDTNNRIVRLSDYANKVIILNFFATWCPSCRGEIPHFIELMDEYGDKDFVIIGISIDRGGTELVRNFVDEQGINYPVLLDDGLVSNAYGPVSAVPTTFIIDEKGNITQKIIGGRGGTYFEDIIKPLIE